MRILARSNFPLGGNEKGDAVPRSFDHEIGRKMAVWEII